MNTEKKYIVLISASPKLGNKSMSEWLASLGEEYMKDENIQISRLNVRKSISNSRTESDYETMINADALIFIFPLYIFCLPGMLMRFLQDFYQYYEEHKDKAQNQKVYTVVNCGFPEPEINMEAVRVIKSFSEKINALFRFGLLIGGGPMVFETKDAPFMKKKIMELNDVYKIMKKDVMDDATQPLENINISIQFPRRLYFFMGGRGWISSARKNGLKKKDLYRKPYRE